MPKIIVEEAFDFSPDGIEVKRIDEGEQEVSERCATVAVEHLKVARLAGDKPDAKPGKKKTKE